MEWNLVGKLSERRLIWYDAVASGQEHCQLSRILPGGGRIESTGEYAGLPDETPEHGWRNIHYGSVESRAAWTAGYLAREPNAHWRSKHGRRVGAIVRGPVEVYEDEDT